MATTGFSHSAIGTTDGCWTKTFWSLQPFCGRFFIANNSAVTVDIFCTWEVFKSISFCLMLKAT